MPSLIINPRYFWSGSIGQFNLSCINKSRKLLLLNANDPHKIRTLPLVAGFLKDRYTIWRYLTRLILILSVLAIAGLFFIPKIISKRSNYALRDLYKAYCVVLILPLLSGLILINFLSYRNPRFDIYSPDNPLIFEQAVLNALQNFDMVSFWLHPDQYETLESSIMRLPYRMHTDPYPDMIRLCKGHFGFLGMCSLDNCLVMPGGQWDVALKDYIKGRDSKPTWCFADINYEEHLPNRNSEAVVWSKTKELNDVLQSIRSGSFYVRYNNATQKLILNQWQIAKNGTSGHIVQTLEDALDIHIALSSTLPGEPVEIWLIRSGEIVARKNYITPCSLTLRDSSIEHSGLSYYRLIVTGKKGLKLISNPIFVNFFKKQKSDSKSKK